MTHLCDCGCGQPTPLARHTNPRRGHVRGEPLRFCHGHNMRGKSGPEHPSWRGGRHHNRYGYITIQIPGERHARFEHVIIAEQALGHALPETVDVHHVNGVRDDNRNCNLVICQDRAYHMLLHQRQRALEACGDPNARRCMYCSGYDRQENISTVVRRDGTTKHYHRTCNAANRRRCIERRLAKENAA